MVYSKKIFLQRKCFKPATTYGSSEYNALVWECRASDPLPQYWGVGKYIFFPELFHFTFSSICNSTACFIPSKHFIPSEHFIPFSIFVKIQCPSSEMNRGFVHQCLTPYPSCSKTATEQCSLTFSQFGRTFTEHSSLAYSHCSKTFTDHCFLTFSQCRKI